MYIVVRMEPVYHPYYLPPLSRAAAAATVQQSQIVIHADHDWRVNHATGKNLVPGPGMELMVNIRVMQ